MAAATTTVALFSTTHHHHPLRSPFVLPHHSPLRRIPTLRATHRTPPTPPPGTTTTHEGGSGDLFEEGLRWGRMEFMGSGGEEEEEEEEEEEDRSLELLVKFVENVFKRVSRRARKAVRAVLPPTISSKLVGFSVNGAIILAFLWVLKAFLEEELDIKKF